MRLEEHIHFVLRLRYIHTFILFREICIKIRVLKTHTAGLNMWNLYTAKYISVIE